MSAVAVVLWLYAGAMLLIGLVFMGVPLIGAPIVIGTISVGIGAYLCRRRPAWASILLLGGGIVVGGTCGVFGEAVSHVEGDRENLRRCVHPRCDFLWFPADPCGARTGDRAAARCDLARTPRIERADRVNARRIPPRVVAASGPFRTSNKPARKSI